MGTYKEWIDKGFSPKAAATAAMGEFGFRKSGAVDTLLFGGLMGASASQMGAMGDEAIKEAGQRAAKQGIEAGAGSKIARGIMKTIKFGGPAVGLATSAGMAYYYNMEEEKLGQQWDQSLQAELMTATKETYGGGIEGERKFQEFQGYLEANPVQNSQELINSISTFYEGEVIFGGAAGESVPVGGAEKPPTDYQEIVDVVSKKIRE